MIILVLIMLAVCIGIPLSYAWRIARLDEPSLSNWLVVVADAAAIVALVLIVGRWDMAGYYARFAVLALFLAAILWSLRRHAGRPWRLAEQPVLGRHWPKLVSLVLFAGALVYVLVGLLPQPGARELAFPLQGGRFVVGQGGGNILLNRHSGHPEQHHAADIVAINGFGYRAAGLAPRRLDRYVVHGARVVSPCAGTVVAAEGGLPDLIPPERDRDKPRGNHVIVDCGGFNVELAHLAHGSVRVSAGASVSSGEPLGLVGNSGNTTEPHLHIHAVDPRTGNGLPMSFGGRQPVRNRLFVR